jgi:hypothetical protein
MHLVLIAVNGTHYATITAKNTKSFGSSVKLN